MIFSMRRISTPSVCLQNDQMQHMDRGEQIIGGVARQLGSSGGRLLVKMVIATVFEKIQQSGSEQFGKLPRPGYWSGTVKYQIPQKALKINQHVKLLEKAIPQTNL